jgi:hypothetical protein
MVCLVCLMCLSVGLSESVGSPRLIEVEKGSCVTTDCVCRCGKREKREEVSRRCWGGDREEVRALDWPAVEEVKVEKKVSRLMGDRTGLQSRREGKLCLVDDEVRLSRAGWGGPFITCTAAWSLSLVSHGRDMFRAGIFRDWFSLATTSAHNGYDLFPLRPVFGVSYPVVSSSQHIVMSLCIAMLFP